MLDLQDKVAVVTGAASGIGRATALLMARSGARVVVADVADAQGIAVVEKIIQAGGQAIYQHVDVSREKDCAAMVEAAVSHFGGLDLAFNNAGVLGDSSLTSETPLEQWRKIIDINLTGVFNCMVHELRVMKARGSGAIVNTASIMGTMGAPGKAAYSASKHGVIGLTRTAAKEYGKYGVRINALCPGYVGTPMTEGGSSARAAIAQLESVVAGTPMRRLGRPEEQAEMVVWLCSDKASFVTGAHYVVDAGATA
ncbi:SDR family oxidoreductase [Cupriavidus necator]|uniref:SDR family NAD(P)-dependent oxidoreductase n=1 Tax=Cupriavidus necator TaxID=106590 RepID=UPI003ECE7DFC